MTGWKASLGERMASVFFSYSHADEALRDQLEKQLSLLKRQGIIDVWHDRRIGGGQDFAQQIDEHVETDDIVLLLVSADFLDSEYCYEKEMKRAMERHETGEAVVIPVILRACDWHGAPFGKLNATPPDGRDKDKFRFEAFEFMAKFFDNSLNELSQRNPGIEGSFRTVDANRFTAAVYKNGQAVAPDRNAV
jgi:TIR domain